MKVCQKCDAVLVQRDLSHTTPEQQYAAQTRFECPRCYPGGSSVTVLSAELREQLDAMRRHGVQLDLQTETI